jgi:glucose/arabinose dehydrogenase
MPTRSVRRLSRCLAPVAVAGVLPVLSVVALWLPLAGCSAPRTAPGGDVAGSDRGVGSHDLGSDRGIAGHDLGSDRGIGGHDLGSDRGVGGQDLGPADLPPPFTCPDPVDPGPATDPAPAADARITVPTGFVVEKIASFSAAVRGLVATPNGDLLVGTGARNVVIVPGAEGPGAAEPFTAFTPDLGDPHAGGVALGGGYLFIGTEHHVFRVPYTPGDRVAQAAPERIADVRMVDGGHSTTSVAYIDGVLYASVGSSCNACVETDPTRATILQMAPDGSGITPKALRWRNAIALAINPDTGTLWASGAEQDGLPLGHPYEPMDAVTLHQGVVDYGWPDCYENRQSVNGTDCSQMPIARVAIPAYSTAIGIAFYSLSQCGAYRFPAEYRGGAFVTLHGSWHGPDQGLPNLIPPRLIYVPMNGDTPVTPANWNDATVQWTEFMGGLQDASDNRIVRPTGVAVGPQGSLFVADDYGLAIYRIRPRR